MTTHATGTFEVKGWDEKPYDEVEGGKKLTRASVTQSFDGDVAGEGKVEYLMAYRDDGTANFVGLQRIVGRVGGRSGSFVLQLAGTYDGRTARADWTVVAGSGTGELAGLRGEGGFSAEHGPSGSVTLDYDLD
jgi:Protein of unknown function (DUF3224)